MCTIGTVMPTATASDPTSVDESLADRRALVSGGTRGAGAAIARRLTADAEKAPAVRDNAVDCVAWQTVGSSVRAHGQLHGPTDHRQGLQQSERDARLWRKRHEISIHSP